MKALFRGLLVFTVLSWFVTLGLFVEAYPKAVWPTFFLAVPIFVWLGSLLERIK